MDLTVDDIYNILSKNTEYSTKLKKNGNQITIYMEIRARNKQARKTKIRQIRDYLKQEAPEVSKFIFYNENGSGSSIGRIEILRKNNQNVIVVFLKPMPTKSFLTDWRLNEEMIVDISNEYKDYADEEGSKYKIIITDGRVNISLNDVNSITRVGGENKKPDIKIATNARSYAISIKMNNFMAWESYSNNNHNIKNQAIKILNNLSNITASFERGSNGVSSMATTDEVKSVCFGGDDNNKVDYIIIADFPKASPSQSFQYNEETKTLTIRVNKIYSRNSQDYDAIRKNCYMLIRKVSNLNISISSQYRGYWISFVPKTIADYSLPGKR